MTNTEILTTSEILDNDMIFSSDISDELLTNSIESAGEVLSDGVLNFIDFGFGFGTVFLSKITLKRGNLSINFPKIINNATGKLEALNEKFQSKRS